MHLFSLSTVLSFPGPLPAQASSHSAEGACPGGICDTAIGEINASSPVALIEQVVIIIVGLAALSAILLIIYSGYKLMVSTGDPERVKSARQTLTAAVVGLLFIVFSLVILQVIAGDILRIPGFE